MTIKNYIIEFLRKKRNEGNEWVAGGTIERYLMSFLPTKGGTIERTCRRMVRKEDNQTGELQRRDYQGFVEYKLIII